MKRLLNYLPLHFVMLLFLGIYAQFNHHFWEFGFINLLLIIVFISVFIFVLKQKKISTFLVFILFFLIGVSAVYVNNSVNYNNYYQKHLKGPTTAILRIDKVLKPSLFNDKYEAEVIQLIDLKTRGKILLNTPKDSLSNFLKVDEILAVKSNFKELITPLNPHQFNYKNYLEKKGIHQQLFLKKDEYLKLDNSTPSLQGIAAKFRNKIQESLKKYHFKADELAVINALLLGQRQEISKELITDYTRAGAIHILAISGLHVGIILLILNWLFKPMERLRNGKLLKTVLVVLLLWMFAFIAGLSASIVRAVTMFTFLAIGMSFRRKKVTEFSLISSIFVLLIVKPMFLFDVGFQLSYLAVFGIIWLQPKLYAIYDPRFILDKKVWELITVSFAAQAGILPLSLYYFHQFPSLFLLSNLIIIPFLGAILIGGNLIISMALLGCLPQVFADMFAFVINKMNNFVSWIAKQEQFLMTDIPFSFLMTLGSYVLIIFMAVFLIDKTAKKLIYFLISIVIIQSVFVFEKYQKNTEKEFIVFHKNMHSILGKRAGSQLEIYQNLDSLSLQKTSFISSYKVGENLDKVLKSEQKSVYQFKRETILVIDSLGVYQLKRLKKPIVVLQYSPKINLERMIKTIKPKEIIADGSSYKSYVKRWAEIAKKQKTPFYYTSKNGAYILRE